MGPSYARIRTVRASPDPRLLLSTARLKNPNDRPSRLQALAHHDHRKHGKTWWLDKKRNVAKVFYILIGLDARLAGGGLHPPQALGVERSGGSAPRVRRLGRLLPALRLRRRLPPGAGGQADAPGTDAPGGLLRAPGQRQGLLIADARVPALTAPAADAGQPGSGRGAALGDAPDGSTGPVAGTAGLFAVAVLGPRTRQLRPVRSLRADPHTDAGRQAEPRLRRHLPSRGIHRHYLLALRQGQLPAAGRGVLCRIGPWRGPGRRPLDPVPVLGGRGGVVGAPGLGSPRRPGARGGPALSRHADGLGGPAAGRNRPAAPRPGRGARLVRVPQSHGLARGWRHRLRQPGADPDSPRLRPQGGLPAAHTVG